MKWVLKKLKVAQLKEWGKNPRQLTEKGLSDLRKSIENFGVAEPLTVNTDYTICGGHGRKKVLQEMGIKEVDCYLPEKKLTPKQFEELNIRLNKNIAGVWDYDILANQFDMPDLIEYGFNEKELAGLDFNEEEPENNYSRKIESPVYEPKNEKPEVSDLVNLEKYNQLLEDINKSKLPEEIKELLRLSATRHIVFNYSKMADFYAHSDKPTQKLMEDSALIIIDFNRAIELGFVKLSEEIAVQYQKEYE